METESKTKQRGARDAAPGEWIAKRLPDGRCGSPWLVIELPRRFAHCRLAAKKPATPDFILVFPDSGESIDDYFIVAEQTAGAPE
jgi:hypothetical protein